MNRLYPWIPALAMMLVSVISYIDRQTLAILAPTIREAAQMSEQEYGWVISAFMIMYTVGNPIWGWLLDRFGLRTGMTAAVVIWTAASAAHAFASDVWEFAIARAILGFGEGATFPGGLRAVVQSLAPNERSRGVAIAYSGGSLGAIVAPLIVTPIEAYWDWHAAFLFTGLIGIAWLVLWQFVARRSDIRNPVAATDAEPQPSKNAHDANPIKMKLPYAFADRRVWAFMFAYALGGAPLAFILYYSTSYLKNTFSMSQTAVGMVLWIPPLGWEVGYFFWGWVSDRLHRSNRPAIVVERQLMLLLAVLSVPLATVPFCSSFPAVMALKFLAMAIAAGFIIVAISYAIHVYSTANSGLIAGLGAGAWGAGFAAASPVFGALFDRHMYIAAFLLAASLPIAGLLLWLGLSRSPSTRAD